jgi:inosine-uridine nucleoside N-ribohydrolase
MMALILCLFIRVASHQIPLIIVADPGVDDTAAIIFAASRPEVSLLGVVSSFGVVDVEQATKNARTALRAAGLSTPVYVGAREPLLALVGDSASTYATEWHGSSGLGWFGHIESLLPVGSAPTAPEPDESGVEFILRCVRAQPGEVNIAIFSPLSTLALALQAGGSSFVRNLNKVSVMGGALDVPGNVAPLAEANFAADSFAAALVAGAFVNEPGKLIIVPLDATLQAQVSATDVRHWGQQWGRAQRTDDGVGVADTSESKAPESPFNGSMMDSGPAPSLAAWFADYCAPFYLQAYLNLTGAQGMPLHDVHAVAALTHPFLYANHERAVAIRVLTVPRSAKAEAKYSPSTYARLSDADGMLYLDRRPRGAGLEPGLATPDGVVPDGVACEEADSTSSRSSSYSSSTTSSCNLESGGAEGASFLSARGNTTLLLGVDVSGLLGLWFESVGALSVALASKEE